MVVITSKHLKVGDRPLIRKFTDYVLTKFVRRGILKKSRVNIRILDDDELMANEYTKSLMKYKAWCTYDGNDNDIKKFTIVLKADRILGHKSVRARLSIILMDLSHELVHVKQYLCGELRDYVDGTYAFLGKRYQPIPDGDFVGDEYYDSPSEIEAYGRERGLYRTFWLRVEKGEIKI